MQKKDSLLWNDWHPVAYLNQLPRGSIRPVQLLDEELMLWCLEDGSVQVWDDRCPHRGAKLTLGKVVDDNVMCPYHGWRFDAEGRCTLRPSQPAAPLPPQPMTTRFLTRVRYGIVWVCLGEPARDVVPFEEFENPALRNIFAGPYQVEACAPRVVENFIDMAHFSFVHEGILGDATSTEIPAYEVQDFTDQSGQPGVMVADMRVMQPRASVHASGPSDVIYSYRISRPLLSILTKKAAGDPDAEAITLFVQPVSEERSRVFMIFSALRTAQTDAEVLAFQDTVFEQDGPVLESQRPKRMPLDPRVELSQRADAYSMAYRRFLKDSGLTYGVTP